MIAELIIYGIVLATIIFLGLKGPKVVFILVSMIIGVLIVLKQPSQPNPNTYLFTDTGRHPYERHAFPLIDAYERVSPEAARMLRIWSENKAPETENGISLNSRDIFAQSAINTFSGDILRAEARYVYLYIQAHLDFLSEIFVHAPNLVNQIHFPKIFGAATAEEVMNFKSRVKLLDAMEAVIRHAVSPVVEGMLYAKAEDFWPEFVQQFQIQNKELFLAWENRHQVSGPKAHKRLALAVLHLCRKAALLPNFKAKMIFARILRGD